MFRKCSSVYYGNTFPERLPVIPKIIISMPFINSAMDNTNAMKKIPKAGDAIIITAKTMLRIPTPIVSALYHQVVPPPVSP